MDRQAIERRDFPIVRRGYEPAAVDAHLRALAGEIEQLSRGLAGGEQASLAAAASTQVQSILHAAETAAADIEREALQHAEDVRGDADRDAQQMREQAIAKSRSHLAAVAQATATLLERVEAVDREVSRLLESLRGGTERLAGDLAAADAQMAALYDAASGRPGPDSAPEPARRARATARTPPQPKPSSHAASPAPAPAAEPAPAPAAEPAPAPAGESAPTRSQPQDEPPVPAEPAAGAATTAENGDIDGARLVALNMALNGESRADTERYLAEHFQLAERQRLVDEVYAAIDA
jgi:cell division septum initiation protein DivIVA